MIWYSLSSSDKREKETNRVVVVVIVSLTLAHHQSVCSSCEMPLGVHLRVYW